MTKRNIYILLILILLLHKSSYAIGSIVDTAKINRIETFNKDRFELLKKFIHSIELQNFQIEKIVIGSFTDVECNDRGWTVQDTIRISAGTAIDVVFSKQGRISKDAFYGRISANLYKDSLNHDKLIKHFERRELPNPTKDYKYFLVTSHFLEKNDSIRQKLGNDLLNNLEFVGSLPTLFTDFINIPDFINTTNLNSYQKNEPKTYLIYKKHHKIWRSSLNDVTLEYSDALCLMISEYDTINYVGWFYISKTQDDFLKQYNLSRTVNKMEEISILGYPGCFVETKRRGIFYNNPFDESKVPNKSNRVKNESDEDQEFYYCNFAFLFINNHTICFELPQTKKQITNIELNGWKNKFQSILERLSPFIKEL